MVNDVHDAFCKDGSAFLFSVLYFQSLRSTPVSSIKVYACREFRSIRFQFSLQIMSPVVFYGLSLVKSLLSECTSVMPVAYLCDQV